MIDIINHKLNKFTSFISMKLQINSKRLLNIFQFLPQAHLSLKYFHHINLRFYFFSNLQYNFLAIHK